MVSKSSPPSLSPYSDWHLVITLSCRHTFCEFPLFSSLFLSLSSFVEEPLSPYYGHTAVLCVGGLMMKWLVKGTLLKKSSWSFFLPRERSRISKAVNISFLEFSSRLNRERERGIAFFRMGKDKHDHPCDDNYLVPKEEIEHVQYEDLHPHPHSNLNYLSRASW